jgi:acyl-CoA dehydrogenase
MDIDLSPADEAFRTEIRDFLEDTLTEALRDGAHKRTSLWQDMDSAMTWQRILHARAGPRRTGRKNTAARIGR